MAKVADFLAGRGSNVGRDGNLTERQIGAFVRTDEVQEIIRKEIDKHTPKTRSAEPKIS